MARAFSSVADIRAFRNEAAALLLSRLVEGGTHLQRASKQAPDVRHRCEVAVLYADELVRALYRHADGVDVLSVLVAEVDPELGNAWCGPPRCDLAGCVLEPDHSAKHQDAQGRSWSRT